MKASSGEIESVVFVVECYTTIIPNDFLKALDSDGRNPKCFMVSLLIEVPWLDTPSFIWKLAQLKNIDAISQPSTFPTKCMRLIEMIVCPVDKANLFSNLTMPGIDTISSSDHTFEK